MTIPCWPKTIISTGPEKQGPDTGISVVRLQRTHTGFAVQIVLLVRIKLGEALVDLAQRRQHSVGPFLTEPEAEDANQFLANRPATFRANFPARLFQFALAGNPDEVATNERLPIHAIGAIDQQLVLPRQSLGPMALAGENIDGQEVGILATIRWRDDDARVFSVREFTIKCVPLLHRSTS